MSDKSRLLQREYQHAHIRYSEDELEKTRALLDLHVGRIDLLNSFSLQLLNASNIDEVLCLATEFFIRVFPVKYAIGLVFDGRNNVVLARTRLQPGEEQAEYISFTIDRFMDSYFKDALELVEFSNNSEALKSEKALFAQYCFQQVFQTEVDFCDHEKLLFMPAAYQQHDLSCLLIFSFPLVKAGSYHTLMPEAADLAFVNLFCRHVERAAENVLYLQVMKQINIELEYKVRERTRELEQSNKQLEKTIDELKLTQESLLQAQKLESIGKLAGGIAHDFNNLLGSILGYATLLKTKLSADPQMVRKMEIIEKSAERGAQLTRQLLGFARQGQYQMKHCNLNDLATEAYHLLYHSVDSSIVFKRELAADLWPVECDPAQIIQIIMNLAINARDAIEQRGEITIRTENIILNEKFWATSNHLEPGNYVRLSLDDSGCGMSSEVRAKIFDPFFTTKQLGEGSGLGLSVVYGIVQAHKSFIDVESTPNQGTCISVYFPAVAAAWDEASSNGLHQPISEDELDHNVLKDATVLVVDDERFIRELMADILSAKCEKVYFAQDGQQAIKLFQQHHAEIDLVVLDMIMPVFAGDEVFRQIRAIKAEMPVVFVSGYAESNQIVGFKRMGNVDFIQKPFSETVLIDSIARLLMYPTNDVHPLLATTTQAEAAF